MVCNVDCFVIRRIIVNADTYLTLHKSNSAFPIPTRTCSASKYLKTVPVSLVNSKDEAITETRDLVYSFGSAPATMEFMAGQNIRIRYKVY